ncbi:iron complex outermembrane recepter protein [Polaromonas sp. YR568]|uniref:TonB-dependent siderophore receptor n=1 Tax=Polaromonas sp. YR568 TaxID=1855301 RepID=UPI0008E78674|nr:TonB-dependent siderophore receptor [Polaromonas sp. YR568]SFU34356.1 iron complex outermembrane recepter protein [Polaromonas sp. YR568]
MLTSNLPRAARRLAPFTALSLAAALQSAYAQTPPAPSAAGAESSLPAVTVKESAVQETATGPVVGYRAKRAATATKTDTPLSETPQAVTVITSQQITDQGATNLQDALGYAAGVRSDAYGLDSRTDSVRVRGASPDNYLDGLREAYGYYTSRTRADPYTLERLEVLRGPSGMLFGAGTAAGVVNMVSKRPQAEAQREVGVQYGSYGRKQFQLDLTGPLTQDGEWLYRLIALKRNSDTQVDYVPDDRSLIAPSLTWRPNAATSLTLQALWQKDKSGSTSQFFPWEGTLLPNPNGRLPTNRFIGEPGDYYDSERKSIGWLFEHKFNDTWTVRQNFRTSSNVNDNRYHYGDFFSSPGSWSADPVGKRLLGRINDSSLTRNRITALDNHAEGHFTTGALKHTLLVGADFARHRENVWSGSTYSEIDAYAPVYGNLVLPDRAALPRTTQRQTGFYLQDQMKLDNWIVMAGLRHDKSVSGAEGRSDEESSATTKRLGLMYAHPSGWSPYVSYSESFTPQAAIKGQLFSPLRGEQWELGLKYEPAGQALAYSAAVYDLREKNQIASPLPDVYTQVGATRTKGVELEVKGPITPHLDLVAHYNYTDLDKQLEGLPKHQASAWAKYRFSIAGVNGFSAGAGVRWMGSFRDLQGGSGPEIPAAALLDLMFAYDTPQWRYALNINNATDKTYFSTCLGRGDCWYGARRSVVASATYRF